jgi:hypothetical protein
MGHVGAEVDNCAPIASLNLPPQLIKAHCDLVYLLHREVEVW